MIPFFVTNSRRSIGRRLFFSVALLLLMFLRPFDSCAHQTPTTIILMDVSPDRVGMELQLPLSELELAFGHPVTKDAETLVERLGPQLKEYLRAHIHPFVDKEHPWIVDFEDLTVDKGEQAASGPPYWELKVHLLMRPPSGVSTRKFTLDYDVIMHQVINHAAFVSIRNDWETGKATGKPAEVGVIHRDMKDNVIYPLQINLEKGDWWTGFKSMFVLGTQHIKEGTDHLLFILVLLMPAMLLANRGRWGSFGGIRYCVFRVLKIVTAFTVGHSITLLIGALGWVRLPAQPVEVLIAISILVSAVHAIRPLFPGKEVFVASGFGLIHGLAFASVLADLHLGAGPMALSILGFNVGIEFMQLAVIVSIIPWLMLLSRTPAYKVVRPAGAVLAGIAAMAWILERTTGQSNVITMTIVRISAYSFWLIVSLAIFAMLLFAVNRDKDHGAFRIIRGTGSA